MNAKFPEFAESLAQTFTRRRALKMFAAGFACIALVSLPTDVMAANPGTLTSSVADPAGDAVFPFNLYDGAVPAYIDIDEASVTLNHGVFHFEIKVNADIPADGDPGFSPPVNHLGSTFGIQTDRKTAEHFNFFGQQKSYYFNYLVGALYLADSSRIIVGRD